MLLLFGIFKFHSDGCVLGELEFCRDFDHAVVVSHLMLIVLYGKYPGISPEVLILVFCSNFLLGFNPFCSLLTLQNESFLILESRLVALTRAVEALSFLFGCDSHNLHGVLDKVELYLVVQRGVSGV